MTPLAAGALFSFFGSLMLIMAAVCCSEARYQAGRGRRWRAAGWVAIAVLNVVCVVRWLLLCRGLMA